MMTSEVPPIPKCLSHLVLQDSDTVLPTDLDRSHPENGCCNSEESGFGSGELGVQDLSICSEYFTTALSEVGSPMAIVLKSPDTLKELAGQSVPSFTGDQSEGTTLNTSLAKLEKEMQDLRFLDMSVFYQLSTLHESIQEYKLHMADRFSETGSEYSLGTASYMGSMSSLNEDWLEEDREAALMSPGGQGQESCPNTSNLLQQITDLTLRAEEDF